LFFKGRIVGAELVAYIDEEEDFEENKGGSHIGDNFDLSKSQSKGKILFTS
jgi:hypothetical protein